jgi:hypothetical protein
MRQLLFVENVSRKKYFRRFSGGFPPCGCAANSNCCRSHFLLFLCKSTHAKSKPIVVKSKSTSRETNAMNAK